MVGLGGEVGRGGRAYGDSGVARSGLLFRSLFGRGHCRRGLLAGAGRRARGARARVGGALRLVRVVTVRTVLRECSTALRVTSASIDFIPSEISPRSASCSDSSMRFSIFGRSSSM